MNQQLLNEFPQLSNGQVYLDSAASTLKLKSLGELTSKYYQFENANIHRGAHKLANEGTNRYETVRKRVQEFIHAREPDEIIFTKGTTDGLNLAAFGICDTLTPNSEIILTKMEHHSNIVPWYEQAKRHELKLQWVGLTKELTLDLEDLKKKLAAPKAKVLALTAISNTLGAINPLKEIIQFAHENNVTVVVDAAQACGHHAIDVQELDVDLLVFGAHKMFGPTGVGVLYGKKELLNSLSPYQGGGSMIDKVTTEEITYLDTPFRFEAGTPNIAGVLGMEAVLDFFEKLDFKEIEKHENELKSYALSELKKLPLTLHLPSGEHSSVISFSHPDIHHGDMGMLLNEEGIAVRTGHHCTQPLMQELGISGTVRVSFSIYNTKADIDKLIAGLKKVIKLYTF